MKMKKLMMAIASSLALCSMGAGAQEQQAAAESGAKDKYAILDQVEADGRNLREVLSKLEIVSEMIPLGPHVTYFYADSGAGLLRGGVFDTGTREFRENLPRICRGEWFDAVEQNDVMTGRTTLVKRKVPANELKEYFHTYGTTNVRNVVWCGEEFEFNGTAGSAFIHHRVGQPFIWKSADLIEPSGKDDLPPDGIIPREWFKPQGKYPTRLMAIAWANRLCELRSGRLSLAFFRNSGKKKERVVVTDMWQMFDGINTTRDYYLHCDAGTDGFLFRHWVSYENNMFFKDPIEVERMAIQRNRDLKSVGF